MSYVKIVIEYSQIDNCLLLLETSKIRIKLNWNPVTFNVDCQFPLLFAVPHQLYNSPKYKYTRKCMHLLRFCSDIIKVRRWKSNLVGFCTETRSRPDWSHKNLSWYKQLSDIFALRHSYSSGWIYLWCYVTTNITAASPAACNNRVFLIFFMFSLIQTLLNSFQRISNKWK